MLKKYVAGTGIASADVLGNHEVALRAIGQNAIQQLQERNVTFSADGGVFAEAYTSAAGRKSSVVTGDTTAVFDTDKYKSNPIFNEDVYILIEATSFGSWSGNNTNVVELASGVWGVYCDTGDDETKRSQIHKSLWYGTTGSDRLIDDFTSVTALKTSVTRDVGKQVHYAKISTTSFQSGSNKTYTGTFANTSTNSDCSIWGKGDRPGTTYSNILEFPDGTVIDTSASASFDNFGIDKSTDELNNPADLQLRQSWANGSPATLTIEAIILCVGDITWVESDSGAGTPTFTNIDFTNDNSVPLFTLGDISIYGSEITHTILTGTFADDISTAFMTFKAAPGGWESGADVQFKLSNTYSGGNINDVSEYTESNQTLATKFSQNIISALTNEINIDLRIDGSTLAQARVIFNYIDDTQDISAIQTTGSATYVTKTFTNPFPLKPLTSVQVQIARTTAGLGTAYLSNIVATLTSYGSDETSYLTSNEIVSFTAFTLEPTHVIKKLIPKTTSPTAGLPSVNGIAVFAGRPD